MKKYNLFKIIGIFIVVYCVLTWIIPASYYSGGLQDLGNYPIGLVSFFQIPLQGLGYFSYIFMFILSVGALYGVLELTGAYRALLDKMVKKTEKQKNVWLIIVTVLVTLISSIFGLDFGMFLILPFLVSYLVLLGYDKKVALLATLGATIVGMFGTTYGYTLYAVNNSILSLSVKDGILIKFILLALGLASLIGIILFNIKESLPKKNTNKKESKKGEKKDNSKVKEEEKSLKFIPEKSEEKGKKTWPLVVVFSLLFIFVLIGTIGWKESFGINFFTNLYSDMMDVKFLSKLFGGLTSFGSWMDHTRYVYYSILIVVTTIILAIAYRCKFDSYLKALFEGAKSNLKAAFLVVLAYIVLVYVSSFPILLTIINWFINLFGGKFNVVTAGISNIIGSAGYVDMYYYPQYLLSYYASLKSVDTTILNILVVSFYSIAMLVVPTSPLLVSMLEKTETSYKEWLKNIWKLFVLLLIIALAVLTIFFVI